MNGDYPTTCPVCGAQAFMSEAKEIECEFCDFKITIRGKEDEFKLPGVPRRLDASYED